MNGDASLWGQILAMAGRIDSRAAARTPIDPEAGVEFARSVLRFHSILSGWASRLSPQADENAEVDRAPPGSRRP